MDSTAWNNECLEEAQNDAEIKYDYFANFIYLMFQG